LRLLIVKCVKVSRGNNVKNQAAGPEIEVGSLACWAITLPLGYLTAQTYNAIPLSVNGSYYPSTLNHQLSLPSLTAIFAHFT